MYTLDPELRKAADSILAGHGAAGLVVGCTNAWYAQISHRGQLAETTGHPSPNVALFALVALVADTTTAGLREELATAHADKAAAEHLVAGLRAELDTTRGRIGTVTHTATGTTGHAAPDHTP